MRGTLVAVGLLALLAVAGPAAAQGSLSVAITEQASTITVQVTQDGEPVEDANVTVRSVGNATPIDGEYVTDADGEVVFEPATTRDITGVVHLRINVDTGTVTTSQLATITRSPDVRESAPLGQRLSMSLQGSVARTRGTVEGTLFVTDIESVENDAGKIDILRSHAERRIQQLRELQLDQETLGRRYATGDIDLETYFTRTIENAGRREMLRQDLVTTLRRIARFDEPTLERNGVEFRATRDLLRRVERGRPIQSGSTISSGR